MCTERKEDSMSTIAHYLEENKEKAYSFATSNTAHNSQGRPIIPKDDEWLAETEWDDLFALLSDQTEKEGEGK